MWMTFKLMVTALKLVNNECSNHVRNVRSLFLEFMLLYKLNICLVAFFCIEMLILCILQMLRVM